MKKYIFYILILGLSSCVVSKKKYDQLSTAKRGVDAKLAEQIATNKENQETINSLNKKVETTTSDFNKLKNEMAENNAAKDDRIAELNSRLANLNADASDLNTKMDKVKFQQSFLERENKENESIISGLKAKIKTLNNSISELNKEKNDANTNAAWAKKEMKTKLAKKEQELAIKQKEIDALNAKITENNKKLSWLRKVKTKNSAEIERLTNQVKLYKKEYEKAISK